MIRQPAALAPLTELERLRRELRWETAKSQKERMPLYEAYLEFSIKVVEREVVAQGARQ